MKTPKFKIGDIVYYILPESQPAMIIDIIYRYRTSEFEYLLGTEADGTRWVFDDEISTERQIV